MVHPGWPESETTEAPQDYPPVGYVPPQLDWLRNGPARPNRRSGRPLIWLVVGVVLVGAGVGAWLLVGRSSSHGSTPPVASGPTSFPSAPTAQPSMSPAQLAALLPQIAIETGDLEPGYTMRLIPDGTKVTWPVTSPPRRTRSSPTTARPRPRSR